jgi:hypothetical protein
MLPSIAFATKITSGSGSQYCGLASGWWINPTTGQKRVTEIKQRQGLLEYAACMMNTHGEISEGREGARKGNKPSDHIREFSFAEEEIADILIRLFETAGAFGFRIAEAVEPKMAFNASREDHKMENRRKDCGKAI